MHLNIKTDGGFIYNSILFEIENNFFIAVASFTDDYPIHAYNLNGNLKKEIPYKGKSFYFQSFEKDSEYFIIISNWNGDLSLYDYKNDLFVMNVKLKGNLKNLFISKNILKETCITFIEWEGRLIEINLFKREVIRESSLIFGNTPALCSILSKNSVILLQGKRKSLDFLDASIWELLYSVPNLHSYKLIINVWNFKFPEFGDVFIPYGFDKTIKILFNK